MMGFILLLQGCSEASKPGRPPGAHPYPDDTGTADSEDSRETDPDGGETDETGNSEGDSEPPSPVCGPAADAVPLPLPDWTKEPMNPEWRGGDPVPGWDDRDCPYHYAPDVLHFDYRTQWEGDLAFGRSVKSPGPPRMYLYRYKPYDFIKEPGAKKGFVFTFELILWSRAIDGGGPPPGDVRGTGWFGQDGTGERITFSAVAITPFDLLLPMPNVHGGAGASTCVRYSGPDRVTGSVYLAPYAPPGQKDGRSPYPIVSYELDFQHLYPEHAAQEANYPFISEFGYTSREVTYAEGTPYAESWPWDEITDPAIRSAIFWRYMPANDPHCYEAMRRTGERP